MPIISRERDFHRLAEGADYGPDEADEDLARMVEVMLPVEVAELAPPGP